ncbi:hypothetical protein [Streptomyces chrestomyceticus]|uniref:hypothetical protein n=1 Tax=Streptomyces chrestomyceticus TaxID=68185 RepID=UPI00340D966E
MDEAEASRQVWRDEVRVRPTAEQDREALARLIAVDADSFEVELYERAAEPQVLFIDRAQRSHVGQYTRRVRRLRERQQRRLRGFRRRTPRGPQTNRPTAPNFTQEEAVELAPRK